MRVFAPGVCPSAHAAAGGHLRQYRDRRSRPRRDEAIHKEAGLPARSLGRWPWGLQAHPHLQGRACGPAPDRCRPVVSFIEAPPRMWWNARRAGPREGPYLHGLRQAGGARRECREEPPRLAGEKCQSWLSWSQRPARPRATFRWYRRRVRRPIDRLPDETA